MCTETSGQEAETMTEHEENGRVRVMASAQLVEETFRCTAFGCDGDPLAIHADPDYGKTAWDDEESLERVQFVKRNEDRPDSEDDQIARMLLRLGGNGF